MNVSLKKIIKNQIFFLKHHINRIYDHKNKYIILLYHRVLNEDIADPVNNYILTDEFYDQLKFINKNYEIVPFNHINNLRSKNQKTKVVITFDDGYSDNYNNAFTILKSFNLNASFFVATNYIDSKKIIWDRELCLLYNYSFQNKINFIINYNKKIIFRTNYSITYNSGFIWKLINIFKKLSIHEINNIIADIKIQLNYYPIMDNDNKFMSWSQLKEMSSNGMLIGSHGHNHLSFSNQNKKNLQLELNVSKKIIEDKLNIVCDTIAFPFGNIGDFNTEVINESIKSGYKKCFLNKHGYNYLSERNITEDRVIMFAGKQYKYLLG